MSSKDLNLDLKLCPGLLLWALTKAEEREAMSDDALQNSASKKAHFLIVSILVNAVFLKVFLCGFNFTLGAERR